MQADHHQFYAGRFPVAFTFIYIQFPYCFLQFLVGWLSETTNISYEIANREERITDIHEKIIAILYIPDFPRAIVTLDSAEPPHTPALQWTHYASTALESSRLVLLLPWMLFPIPSPPVPWGHHNHLCCCRDWFSCKTVQEDEFSFKFSLVAWPGATLRILVLVQKAVRYLFPMEVTACDSSSCALKWGLKSFQDMKDSIILVLQDSTEKGSGGGYTTQTFKHEFTGQPPKWANFHMNQNFSYRIHPALLGCLR